MPTVSYSLLDQALLQMGQYGAGPQRGPMGQSLMGGLNSVGQRGMPSNAGLSQAALQRQAGGGVNIGGLGAASGGPLSCLIMQMSDVKVVKEPAFCAVAVH